MAQGDSHQAYSQFQAQAPSQQAFASTIPQSPAPGHGNQGQTIHAGQTINPVTTAPATSVQNFPTTPGFSRPQPYSSTNLPSYQAAYDPYAQAPHGTQGGIRNIAALGSSSNGFQQPATHESPALLYPQAGMHLGATHHTAIQHSAPVHGSATMAAAPSAEAPVATYEGYDCYGNPYTIQYSTPHLAAAETYQAHTNAATIQTSTPVHGSATLAAAPSAEAPEVVMYVDGVPISIPPEVLSAAVPDLNAGLYALYPGMFGDDEPASDSDDQEMVLPDTEVQGIDLVPNEPAAAAPNTMMQQQAAGQQEAVAPPPQGGEMPGPFTGNFANCLIPELQGMDPALVNEIMALDLPAADPYSVQGPLDTFEQWAAMEAAHTGQGEQRPTQLREVGRAEFPGKLDSFLQNFGDTLHTPSVADYSGVGGPNNNQPAHVPNPQLQGSSHQQQQQQLPAGLGEEVFVTEFDYNEHGELVEQREDLDVSGAGFAPNGF